MNDFLDIPHACSLQLLQFAQPIQLNENITSYILALTNVKGIWQSYDLARPDYLLNAIPKRLDEFYAGRILAQGILQRHFNCVTPISSLQHKLPIWPQGLSGSISHSNQHVIVTVAANAQYLGIDIEQVVEERFAHESHALILTGTELQLWQSGQINGFDFCQYVTLIFSLKESLYKAVYPVAQHYIDFLEAAVVQVDMQQQTVKLEFCNEIRQKYGLLVHYQGDWKIQENYVLSWVFQAI